MEDLAEFFGYSSVRALETAVFGLAVPQRYFEFEIPKKSGSPRQLQAPYGELKRVQRQLAVALGGIYHAPNAVHGFVDGRSILTNASAHLRRDYVFNIDLKDFFGSIHFGRVRGLFQAAPFFFPNDVARVLAHTCCYDGALPQGAPTSPIVSNMICRTLDRELSTLAREQGCTYTRYVDDMSFSFCCRRNELPSAIVDLSYGEARPGEQLVAVLGMHQFKINHEKVRLANRSSRMEVTGLTVNESPNVRARFVRQISAMLHAWRKFSLPEAQREYDEEYDKSRGRSRRTKDFRHVVAGKLSFLLSVRGIDDPAYVKLATEFNSLVGDDSMVLPVPQVVTDTDKTGDIESIALVEPSESHAPSADIAFDVPQVPRNELVTTDSLDRQFMLLAIEKARKCTSESGKTSPKVGAVAARGGILLGSAHRGELKEGEHAEYTLLEGMLTDSTLAGATLYTTLEPCTSRNHPKLACALRIIQRKIGRVVVGMIDPNREIGGLGVRMLHEANIEVAIAPIDLVQQIEELNREFTNSQTQSTSSDASVPEGGDTPGTSSRGQLESLEALLRRGRRIQLEYGSRASTGEWDEVCESVSSALQWRNDVRATLGETDGKAFEKVSWTKDKPAEPPRSLSEAAFACGVGFDVTPELDNSLEWLRLSVEDMKRLPEGQLV